MAANRLKSLALIPNCDVLEGRLALSGNFLSHGFADVSRAVDHLDRHHTVEHATMKHDHAANMDGGVKVHYHHITEGSSK